MRGGLCEINLRHSVHLKVEYKKHLVNLEIVRSQGAQGEKVRKATRAGK